MTTRTLLAALCLLGILPAQAQDDCAPGPRVTRLVAEQLMVDPADVTPSANFQTDLKADELDIVELVMAFEEEFDLNVSDEDLESMETVGEAVAYFEARVTCPAATPQ
jgi:acyl carrier protein